MQLTSSISTWFAGALQTEEREPSLLLHYPPTPAELIPAVPQDKLWAPELQVSSCIECRVKPHHSTTANVCLCVAAFLALLVTVWHPLTSADKPHALQILLQACFWCLHREYWALLCSHQQDLRQAFFPCLTAHLTIYLYGFLASLLSICSHAKSTNTCSNLAFDLAATNSASMND